MELVHIPLSELAIAKVNVRHGVKKADYKNLNPNIKDIGSIVFQKQPKLALFLKTAQR